MVYVHSQTGLTPGKRSMWLMTRITLHGHPHWSHQCFSCLKMYCGPLMQQNIPVLNNTLSQKYTYRCIYFHSFTGIIKKKEIIHKNLIEMVHHSHLLRKERLMNPFSGILGYSLPPHKNITHAPAFIPHALYFIFVFIYLFTYLPTCPEGCCLWRKTKQNKTMECGVDRRQANLLSSDNKS